MMYLYIQMRVMLVLEQDIVQNLSQESYNFQLTIQFFSMI